MNPLESHWKSIYINIDFATLYHHTFDWAAFHAFFSQLQLHEVEYCYIKMSNIHSIHYAESGVIEKCVNDICEGILCKLPKIGECTFECLDTTPDMKVYIELLHALSIGNTHVNDKIRKCIEKISIRISMSDTIYHQLISFYTTTKHATTNFFPRTLRIDVSWIVSPDNFTHVMQDIITCTNQEHSLTPTHVSFEWNIPGMITEDEQSAHITEDEIHSNEKHSWGRMSDALCKQGLLPYQVWHFAKEGSESQYLSSIYAMESYLGINLEKDKDATSWAECVGANPSSYLGLMKHNYDIEWEEISFNLELEMRIQQAQSTHFLSLPIHLKNTCYKHHFDVDAHLNNKGFIKSTGSAPSSTRNPMLHQKADRELWLFPLQKYMRGVLF